MIYEILLMLYVLGTIAGLWFIFKKAGRAPWKALVPFYNIVVWIQLCGKKWPWYIYFLLPGLNIFVFLLMVVDTAKVFRRKSFWEETFGVLLPPVYLLMVGLKKGWTYHDPKTAPPTKVSELRDWAEAVVFALIAVVLIRGFVFELFSIPSSSMERSLRVGDHLLVSKMAYGPRVIMTPLALPLMHNTIVGTDLQSYLSWPQLPYYRFPGYTHVKRYDAVVFNFPEGDTIVSNFPGCQRTYYEAVRACGREAVLAGEGYFIDRDAAGNEHRTPAGKVMTRPLDKREHYIKRCMGLPGENLQIVDGIVHINGQPVETPESAMFYRKVTFSVNYFPIDILEECGMTKEEIDGILQVVSDINGDPYDSLGNLCLGMALSPQVSEQLLSSGYVKSISPYIHDIDTTGALFPHAGQRWSVDNYGPVHIPAKGETLKLTLDNLPFYRRLITAYEYNTLEVRDGKIYINGKETDSYTCQMDYYWMMGDNRHNSQDSRFWGFVPESHIVGKAKWVLFSTDEEKGGIRWDRCLRNANAY